MVIYDSNGKKINLTDRHFIAEGGEGKLFSYRGRVYKIYLDPAKIIPSKKMDELSRLDNPFIVRPLESVYGRDNNRIGFSMIEVSNGIPMPRLFTTSFWDSNSITPKMIAELVGSMQKTIGYIHEQGFLQVDGNEFNYMVNGGFSKPYFIDVDSYQTPGYPATAIMPSIRDYTQDGFNEGTDWFSFAVVVFQLYAGIHPFKGRHPDFKRGSFEDRVKAGISVLNKEVTYPSSVRDFSVIPKNYFEWFRLVFEKGERLEPPSGDIQIAVRAKRHVIRDTSKITVKLISEYPEEIVRFNVVNGQRIIRAGNILYVGNRPYDIPKGAKSVYMRDTGNPVFMVVNEGIVGAMDAESGVISLSGMAAEKVFVAENVPYIICDDDLIELNVTELGEHLMISPGPVRKILPNATTIFNNIILESVLGRTHLLIPVRAGEMPIIRIPELDAFRVIDGRYERGVVVFVAADKQGDYKQVRIRFSEDFTRYDLDIRDDMDDPMNFTVLSKGVIISIPGDGRLEVSPAKFAGNAVREVDDPQVGGFMRLYNDGDRVIAVSGKSFYAIALTS